MAKFMKRHPRQPRLLAGPADRGQHVPGRLSTLSLLNNPSALNCLSLYALAKYAARP
jgi:hypothetical protein